MTATPAPPDKDEDETRGPTRRVLREQRRADEVEALAVIAERRYYARRTRAYRAYGLDRVRAWSAWIGAVLMLGLGAWSAVGVHHAVAAGAPVWSPDWLLGWILEPILLAGVALIVIVRAHLAANGARLTPWAWIVELGLLTLSLAANVHALPVNYTPADLVLRMTGPVGCLLVSCVLVAVDRAIRDADIETEPESATAAAARWSAVLNRVGNAGITTADRLAAAFETAVEPARDQTATGVTNGRDHRSKTGTVTGHDHRDHPATTGHDPVVTTGGFDRDHPWTNGTGRDLVTALTCGDQSVTGVTNGVTTPMTNGVTNGATTWFRPGHDQIGTSVTTGHDRRDHPGVTTPAATGPDDDHTVTNGVTTPAQKTVEEVVDALRELDPETRDGSSERPLADLLGCSRGTVRKARERLRAEHAASGDETTAGHTDGNDDTTEKEG